MKKRLLPLFFIILSIILTGCEAKEATPVTSKSGFYFNTYIAVTIYSQADETVLDECMKIAEKYDFLWDKNKETSDIYKINHAKSEPVTVDADTIDILNEAIYYAEFSNGLVDPTIGSVSKLWNFTKKEPAIPDSAILSEAITHVDYKKISLSENTVSLEDSLSEIDLGFIAKGYVADKIKDFLLSKGVDEAVINLGGNVQTINGRQKNEDGSFSPFIVGIADPSRPNRVITSVEIIDKSVVTSGSYQRYFELDGKLYHHILDAKTGYPVENNLSGVSIIGESSLKCDALSTICFIMGLEDSVDLINSIDGYEAVFVTTDGSLIRTAK